MGAHFSVKCCSYPMGDSVLCKTIKEIAVNERGGGRKGEKFPGRKRRQKRSRGEACLGKRQSGQQKKGGEGCFTSKEEEERMRWKSVEKLSPSTGGGRKEEEEVF